MAFGTGEGRVGVYDTNNTAKLPSIYFKHHRHCVYALGWGPTPEIGDIGLWSCGNGELIYYSPENPTKGIVTIRNYLNYY